MSYGWRGCSCGLVGGRGGLSGFLGEGWCMGLEVRGESLVVRSRHVDLGLEDLI